MKEAINTWHKRRGPLFCVDGPALHSGAVAANSLRVMMKRFTEQKGMDGERDGERERERKKKKKKKNAGTNTN